MKRRISAEYFLGTARAFTIGDALLIALSVAVFVGAVLMTAAAP